MNWLNRTHIGDCRELLARMATDGVRVQTCVTSPPYFGLRDYGNDAQVGLEETPDEYIRVLVCVFREVRELLADDGTLWLNLGDSYAGSSGGGGASPKSTLTGGGGRYRDGSKAAEMFNAGSTRTAYAGAKRKDLLGIPWRVALALQADGWYLRSDIIWHKPNPMPESVTDRPTKSHEYLFLLAKSERYYYDHAAIKEPARYPGDHGFLRGPIEGCDSETVAWRTKSQQDQKLAGADSKKAGNDWRNRRTVWTVPTQPFSGAHFACFPPALIEPCILAGAPAGGIVLDPFMGSGTTAQVATSLGRQFIGCELNADYVALHEMRTTTQGMAL